MKIVSLLFMLCLAVCKTQFAKARRATINVHGTLSAQEEEFKENLERILGDTISSTVSKGIDSHKGSMSKGLKGSKGVKGSKGKGSKGSKATAIASFTAAEYSNSGSEAVTAGLVYVAVSLMVLAAVNV